MLLYSSKRKLIPYKMAFKQGETAQGIVLILWLQVRVLHGLSGLDADSNAQLMNEFKLKHSFRMCPTGSAGDLLNLPRAVRLLSPDPALLFTSDLWAALDLAPASRQGHGAHESESSDPHGSAGVGQGHSIVPAGAWRCQSASNRESVL